MKKNIKLALICALLIGCGFVLFLVLDTEPEARAKPAGRDLDLLFEKMGVVRVAPGTTTAVDLRLPDINGLNVALSDFRGKIVLLNFWATWCPTCVAEMPAMQKLHRGLGEKDFAIVAISLGDSAEQVKDFFKKHKLTFTALLDSTGELGARFGLRGIPTTIILDKAGQAIGIAIGLRDWDSRESMELFKRLADIDPAVSTGVAAEPG